jgi:hypothetical protein
LFVLHPANILMTAIIATTNINVCLIRAFLI